MCERSAIFCWSNVYTVGPIIYTTLCERHFYYMERGIQPNLQRLGILRRHRRRPRQNVRQCF